jgi:DNA repair protein RecO (recombination protein O)
MNNILDVIVLSQSLYKENDALVQVLSKDLGLMTFIAKGVQKMTSKNRAVIQPYSSYRYHCDLKSGALQTLKNGERLVSNHHISSDLYRSSLAALISELTFFLLKNEVNEVRYAHSFHQLDALMRLVDQSDHLQHVFILALILFINDYGIEPLMDGCVLCGDTQRINSFSVEEGGLVCSSCQREIHSPILSPETLRALRISARVSLDHFEAFCASTQVSEEHIRIWINFIEYHSSLQLKAWEFIRKWSII